jgi:CDGSH-type Zn-finger protein
MVTKTNSPLPVKVEAGTKYSWCSCGFSQTMPLCDHSHRELSDKKSVKFVAEDTYAAAQGHKLRLTAMAATTAGKSDGYRNRT